MSIRAAVFLSCIATTPFFSCVEAADKNTWKNNIPPRQEWNNNSGYCGEVCLISAGLYYGQYISQYDVRALISDGEPQNKCQVLLGLNDKQAIDQLHLNAIYWDTESETDTDQFIAWVKQNVVKGYPVAIGLYTNEYLFYNDTDPTAGDKSYDHIVSVYGVGSNSALSNPNYFSDDILYYSDNGLWGKPDHYPYLFNQGADDIQASRREANAQNGPIYSLSDNASNYGIAITGIKDLNGDTLPVRVDTNANAEKPPINDGSNQRPASMPLILTITLSNLQPGVLYYLYRYNDLSKVPDSQFNAHATNAYQSWKVQIKSGNSFTMRQSIQSNEMAIYRAVRSTAP